MIRASAIVRVHGALTSGFDLTSFCRRAEERIRGTHPAFREVDATRALSSRARRSILFITVDQQRFDALGVNGGRSARRPVLDRLAREGVNYRRAYVPNVVCMPSRASMLTGQ